MGKEWGWGDHSESVLVVQAKEVCDMHWVPESRDEMQWTCLIFTTPSPTCSHKRSEFS